MRSRLESRVNDVQVLYWTCRLLPLCAWPTLLERGRVLRVSQLDVNGAELLFQTWRLRVTPTPFDAAFYVCECVDM